MRERRMMVACDLLADIRLNRCRYTIVDRGASETGWDSQARATLLPFSTVLGIVRIRHFGALSGVADGAYVIRRCKIWKPFNDKG